MRGLCVHFHLIRCRFGDEKGSRLCLQVLEMPSLSPTMTKGSLLKWHVKEGTTVESGDTIAEIETDKATMDYDAIEEGIMAKILIVEGTKDIEV